MNLMIALFARLNQSEGLKHSILTVFSYGFASFFSAIAIILISRLMGPSNFADFSVAFSLSLMLNRINDFGFSTVIQKFVGGAYASGKQTENISAYLSIILKWRLLISLLITCIGIIFQSQIAAYLHISNPLLIPLTFIFSLPVSYFELAQITLQSLSQFKVAAYNYLLPSFIKFIMAVVIFFLKIDNVTLILSIYLLSSLPSLLIAEFSKPKWVKYLFKEKFKEQQTHIFSLLRHSFFAVVATGIIENIDALFAKHYLSAYEAGLFAGASRIAMFLYVVAYALGSVLNPRVTAYKNRLNFNSYIKKSIVIAGLSIIGFLLSLPLAAPLIHWTIGPAYAESNYVLMILMSSGFIGIASTPFIATFYMFKNNNYFSLAAFLQISIILIGNIYFVPLFGSTAGAYTRVVAKLALLLFTVWMLWKNYKKEFVSK